MRTGSARRPLHGGKTAPSRARPGHSGKPNARKRPGHRARRLSKTNPRNPLTSGKSRHAERRAAVSGHGIQRPEPGSSLCDSQ